MRTSEKIALGSLIVLGVASLAIGRLAANALETRVHQVAASAVRAADSAGVEVLVDGLNVTLHGRVANAGERERVVAATREAVGLGHVVDNLMVVEPLVDLRPAIFRLERDADGVILSGEAPNPEARDLLLARIRQRFAPLAPTNLMKTQDRRAESGWLSAAEAAIDALAQLDRGAASVERGELRLDGAVGDASVKSAVQEMLARRVSDAAALEVSIDAPPPQLSPYPFSARKAGGALIVEACAAPDEAAQAAIVAALSGRGAVGRPETLCPIALGAPGPGWTDAVLTALRAMDQLIEGEARIVDSAAEIVGFASNAEAAGQAAGAGWPPGFEVAVDARPDQPPASPFAMTISKRPGEARLTGRTPSAGRAVLWAERLDATNALELARGAPQDWIAAVDILVDFMRAMPFGEAELRDYDLRLAAPGDASVRARLRGRLQARLPRRFRLQVVEAAGPTRVSAPLVAREGVERPVALGPGADDPIDSLTAAAGQAPAGAAASSAAPGVEASATTAGAPLGAAAREADARFGAGARDGYLFVARKTAGGASIAGAAGDETSLATISTYARAKLGGRDLQIDLEVGDMSPPAGWQRAVFASIDALALLDEGEAVAEPGATYLRGGVSRAIEAREAVAAAKAKTPDSFTHFSWIMVREDGRDLLAAEIAAIALEPRRCVALANEFLRVNPVPFEPGRAELGPRSDPSLDRLGELLRRCPDARVVVTGHTDSDGDPEENLRLSRQRAFAVRLALIARGVEGESVASTGFGAERPVATNDTAEGRAANRRIELALQ